TVASVARANTTSTSRSGLGGLLDAGSSMRAVLARMRHGAQIAPICLRVGATIRGPALDRPPGRTYTDALHGIWRRSVPNVPERFAPGLVSAVRGFAAVIPEDKIAEIRERTDLYALVK